MRILLLKACFLLLPSYPHLLSFPPIYEVLTSDIRKTFSVEGSKKFLSAVEALQTNYRSKINIIAEKIKAEMAFYHAQYRAR